MSQQSMREAAELALREQRTITQGDAKGPLVRVSAEEMKALLIKGRDAMTTSDTRERLICAIIDKISDMNGKAGPDDLADAILAAFPALAPAAGDVETAGPVHPSWDTVSALKDRAEAAEAQLAEARQAGMAADLWLEFFDNEIKLCGLCGNTGKITHSARSAAGYMAHVIDKPCICPNGRAIRAEMGK